MVSHSSGMMFLATEGTWGLFPSSILLIFSGSPTSKSFFFHSICHAICLLLQSLATMACFPILEKNQPHVPFLLSYDIVSFPIKSLTVLVFYGAHTLNFLTFIHSHEDFISSMSPPGKRTCRITQVTWTC